MRAGFAVLALAAVLAGPLSVPTYPISAADPESSSSAARRTRGAPLFDGLGDHHHPISTKSPQAQEYFDQGLILAYGFNHQEAKRSFEEAARLDPDAPMPYWGIALVQGPNINRPMPPEHVVPAWDALQKARARMQNGTPKERAYIEALSRRYAPEPVMDRSALDRAYADAMRGVYERYPEDTDAATLYAEAVMDTMPWNYWTAGKEPKPGTPELLAALEHAMDREPYHPGATHLYIHAVESGPNPERGLTAADRLRTLAPRTGHLIHMPGHIYLRLGMYHLASLANERAVRMDEEYIASCNVQGFYPIVYYPHNYHFLWYSTMMEGRGADALNTARAVIRQVTDDHLEAERLRPLALFTLVRFGRWEEALREPLPQGSSPYVRGMWHYGRGLAYTARGEHDRAAEEAAALDRIVNSPEGKAMEQPNLYGHGQLRIAHAVLEGERASARGRHPEAVRHLQQAVDLQDALPYMEPPYWYYPVRQSLGRALLDAGRPQEAETVFRNDLRRHPMNGWALHGLAQSLRAQGKEEVAAEVDRQFEHAWIRADFGNRYATRGPEVASGRAK